MNFLKKLVLLVTSGKLIATIVRRAVRASSRILPLPFDFLVELNCLERPQHAYCIWNAAKLAQELGYHEISVAEFGVAGGNTLLIVEQYAKTIEEALGIHIKVYGFDSGGGMPPPESEKDLPYWFATSQYAMDVAGLKSRLQSAELILGNLRDTVPGFFTSGDRPPLAAIFNDVDYFSSSRDLMAIFDTGDKNFLPRVFLYLDDILGSPKEMYGPFNGQLAANELFNQTHDRIKVHLNQNLLPVSSLGWRHQIYYAHLFDHPKYQTYIGGTEQTNTETSLQLKR